MKPTNLDKLEIIKKNTYLSPWMLLFLYHNCENANQLQREVFWVVNVFEAYPSIGGTAWKNVISKFQK